MKITISYIPAEAQAVDAIPRIRQGRLPGAKVRKSTAPPPQISVYLTTNWPRKDCGAKKTP